MISVSESDGIFFWNFLGDLTFCDTDINYELDKIAHTKEEKPKKIINVNKLSNKQQKEEKEKIDQESKKKENRFNIHDTSGDSKNMLIMLPVEKDIEGNYDTSKISPNVISQSNEKPKTFDELDRKLLFQPLHIPQKFEKLLDKEPSQSLRKLTKRFCVGYNNNSMSNLIYNKENNWFAFTMNNKVIFSINILFVRF